MIGLCCLNVPFTRLIRQVAARFQQSYNTSKTQSRSVEPLLFQKFSDFQSLYGKKNASTYKQLFGHQLRQVHGCSTSAANALMDRFGTTASFMKFLSTTEKGYVLVSVLTLFVHITTEFMIYDDCLENDREYAKER